KQMAVGIINRLKVVYINHGQKVASGTVRQFLIHMLTETVLIFQPCHLIFAADVLSQKYLIQRTERVVGNHFGKEWVSQTGLAYIQHADQLTGRMRIFMLPCTVD